MAADEGQQTHSAGAARRTVTQVEPGPGNFRASCWKIWDADFENRRVPQARRLKTLGSGQKMASDETVRPFKGRPKTGRAQAEALDCASATSSRATYGSGPGADPAGEGALRPRRFAARDDGALVGPLLGNCGAPELQILAPKPLKSAARKHFALRRRGPRDERPRVARTDAPGAVPVPVAPRAGRSI